MSKRTCNRKLYPYLNALMFISNFKRPLVLESWLKRKEIRWNSEETNGSNEKMKNMHREVVFVTDQRRGEAISLTVRARRDRLSNRHLSQWETLTVRAGRDRLWRSPARPAVHIEPIPRLAQYRTSLTRKACLKFGHVSLNPIPTRSKFTRAWPVGRFFFSHL